MKRPTFLSFVAAMALAVILPACAQSKQPLTVMTYNVRNARGLDEKTDIQRIAGVISRQNPDVVAVQELDSMTNRSGNRYVLGELASQLGMYAVYSPAIDFDGGRYGVGILCREKPMSVKRMALPGREERRTFVMAEFPGYVMGCAHLSLNDSDRVEGMKIMAAEASRLNKPLIVAGDFNDTPESEMFGAMISAFTPVTDTDRFTFPADTPDRTIDYIAVSSRFAPESYESKVVEEPVASDHRPIVTVISW